MRLTSRLLALVLLVFLAGFTNLVSPISQADEGIVIEESSACTDGCWREYEYCMGKSTPPNQGKCATEQAACEAKCK